jgi:hypothetical protein
LIVTFALGTAHKAGEWVCIACLDHGSSRRAGLHWVFGVECRALCAAHWAPGTGHWALADTGIVGDDDNWTETHYRLGLVLLILGILQAVYGWGIHLERVRLPVVGAASILRYAHPVVGVSGILCSMWLSLGHTPARSFTWTLRGVLSATHSPLAPLTEAEHAPSAHFNAFPLRPLPLPLLYHTQTTKTSSISVHNTL